MSDIDSKSNPTGLAGSRRSGFGGAWMVLAVAALLVAACGSNNDDELAETHQITGFGYSIDYPAGWVAETRETLTVIAETEGQVESGLTSNTPPTGPTVSLDHRTLAFLRSVGYTGSDDPTAEDLLAFNTANFGWTDLEELGEAELFGAPAVGVRHTDTEGTVSLSYQGFIEDSSEAFLFTLAAASDEQLDDFLPTWEAMIESITPSS